MSRQKILREPAPAGENSFAEAVERWPSIPDFIASSQEIHWTHDARVVSDPPEKAKGGDRHNWLMRELLPAIRSGKQSLEIISPYFIPGAVGTSNLAKMVRSGVEVSVLTNSLAATDVAAVHGAYAFYRRRLLRGGVKLYELQPYAGQPTISVFGSKGASLHTKAFTVDDRTGFVGSFNFDPRSMALNTEMGVLFEHPALVAEMRRRFAKEISPQTSYALSFDGFKIRWEGAEDSQIREYGREPGASVSRRLVAMLVRHLPVESQL